VLGQPAGSGDDLLERLGALLGDQLVDVDLVTPSARGMTAMRTSRPAAWSASPVSTAPASPAPLASESLQTTMRFVRAVSARSFAWSCLRKRTVTGDTQARRPAWR
jgi:hypothetical protein